MPFLTAESCGQKCPHQFQRQSFANHARSQAKHVHLVVFHALVGGICVVTDRGTNSAHFVCRHRRSHATAADQNSALGPAFDQRLCNVRSMIGVVVRRYRVMGSQVQGFMAKAAHLLQHGSKQRRPCVVCGNGDLHLLCPWAKDAAMDSLACFTTFSTVKSNFLKTSFIGPEAPNCFWPTTLP